MDYIPLPEQVLNVVMRCSAHLNTPTQQEDLAVRAGIITVYRFKEADSQGICNPELDAFLGAAYSVMDASTASNWPSKNKKDRIVREFLHRLEVGKTHLPHEQAVMFTHRAIKALLGMNNCPLPNLTDLGVCLRELNDNGQDNWKEFVKDIEKMLSRAVGREVLIGIRQDCYTEHTHRSPESRGGSRAEGVGGVTHRRGVETKNEAQETRHDDEEWRRLTVAAENLRPPLQEFMEALDASNLSDVLKIQLRESFLRIVVSNDPREQLTFACRLLFTVQGRQKELRRALAETSLPHDAVRALFQAARNHLDALNKQSHVETPTGQSTAAKISFGERLRELREKKGLTAKELAKKAKMSPPNITRYEQGEHFPWEDQAKRLAEALEVPLEELLSQNPEK